MSNEKVSIEPQLQDRSILAADRVTEETRKIETDADGNLYVNVAAGTITPVGTQDVNIIGSDIDVPVQVQNFPAVQPVSGPLTDVQLRATAVPVTIPTPVAVTGPLTDVQLRASAVPVSAASLPLPSGAATEATLALVKAKTDNLDVALSTRTKPSDTQLVDGSAHVQPVSGTVAVSNFPASQPVTGPLTDTQLRATPVPISGTVGETVGATAVVTRVTVSAIVATLKAANSARIQLIVHNETGTLFVKLGSGATDTDYTYRLTANTLLEINRYTGIVTAIKASGSSAAQVTEF